MIPMGRGRVKKTRRTNDNMGNRLLNREKYGIIFRPMSSHRKWFSGQYWEDKETIWII